MLQQEKCAQQHTTTHNKPEQQQEFKQQQQQCREKKSHKKSHNNIAEHVRAVRVQPAEFAAIVAEQQQCKTQRITATLSKPHIVAASSERAAASMCDLKGQQVVKEQQLLEQPQQLQDQQLQQQQPASATTILTMATSTRAQLNANSHFKLLASQHASNSVASNMLLRSSKQIAVEHANNCAITRGNMQLSVAAVKSNNSNNIMNSSNNSVTNAKNTEQQQCYNNNNMLPAVNSKLFVTNNKLLASKPLQQQPEKQQQQEEQQQQQQQLQQAEPTIDFNSRRRRGRLRLPQQQHFVADVAASFNFVPAATLQLLRHSATCAANVAYRFTVLLTSLLLSFIVDYVNIITKLVLSATICRRRRRHIAALLQQQCLPQASNNTRDCCGSIEWQQSVSTDDAAAAKTLVAHKNDNNNSRSHSNSRSIGNNNSNMQLIYAFMLCSSILLLPCSNNLVAAAKPKSATQLQKQQQQHQSHQPIMPPQHVAFESASGGGGAGGKLTPPPYQVISSQTSNEEPEFSYPSSQSEEHLFDEEEQNLNDLDEEEDNAAYETHGSNDTHAQNETVKSPLFPKDLFTKEQLENGAVICHIMGVIYMFVALAIVCDEFFVPSLDVIIEKLDITDDVAGATFMAAGGSAPELFTSVIGVFISFDDVGIGTIVGSAVFNILFVIGMCALFSKTVLTLTWWPLFRDCSFYSISLLVLIYFFRDNFIFWWEALILFLIYVVYVAFMKWNVQVERCVKKVITKNKPGGSVTSRAASESRSGPPGSSSGAGATGNSSGTAGSTHTGAKFRHGLLQLMIHTIDPLHDDDVPGKVDEKATQLHAIASLKVLLDATKPQRGGATTSAANHVKINLKETTLADRPNGNIDTTLDSTHDIEEEPEPLSMAWPDTARKRLTYILVAPLLIPMWLTLPDTRSPRGKKYFPVTFIGSILWIAAFSYLMVWWANVAGDTARIPPEVMGLTFLAAGTSIPDLITSVIVARKGFGDMAVSSSVGSNIFDVTVGLPIPWMIYGFIYGAPVEVNSVGMVCSITILFMMLVFVVLSIACFHWRMNKGLGFTMFLLYFVFVAVSLMFEYDIISCPV